MSAEKNSYGLEVENKFLTDQATLESLIDFFSRDHRPFIVLPVERDERTNTYYDTQKKFRLYERGMECRMRTKKDKIQKVDLKTPGDLEKPEIGPNDNGLMYRGEYSCITTDHAPSLSCFAQSAAADHINDIQDKTLTPWVEGTFKRWKVTFAPADHLDSKIEMALERGRFASTDGAIQSEEHYFIEFESKDGHIPALLTAIEQFKAQHGDKLTLSMRTKGEMGLEWLATQGGLPTELTDNFNSAQKKRRKLYTSLRAEQDDIYVAVQRPLDFDLR
jgi:inorganic triphosphatase YgiF